MTGRDGAGAPQGPGGVPDREELARLNVDQLLKLAAEAHIDGRSRMGKAELLDALASRSRFEPGE